MKKYDFIDDCIFNVTPEFAEYLNDLDPEFRAKQIEILNRNEQIYKDAVRSSLEGIKKVWNGSEYDPEEEYFFMDFKDPEKGWIRNPLMTMDDIQFFFQNKSLTELMSYANMRITPERYLSELHQNIQLDGTKRGVGIAVNDSHLTEREFLFGEMYEFVHEDTTDVTSLSKDNEESFDEWEERVRVAKEKEEAEDF